LKGFFDLKERKKTFFFSFMFVLLFLQVVLAGDSIGAILCFDALCQASNCSSNCPCWSSEANEQTLDSLQGKK
jgi:hypothetical protein